MTVEGEYCRVGEYTIRMSIHGAVTPAGGINRSPSGSTPPSVIFVCVVVVELASFAIAVSIESASNVVSF